MHCITDITMLPDKLVILEIKHHQERQHTAQVIRLHNEIEVTIAVLKIGGVATLHSKMKPKYISC